MAARPILGLLSLLFVAGALLLMLFIILGGAINHAPVNRWYFLQADTGNIPHAPTISRWTFWNICPVVNGRSVCGHVHPAFPFDPSGSRNFGTTSHVPHQFIGTKKWYLESRFMFAFELIALFFAGCSLLTGVLALCTRIGAYLSGFLALMALIFQTAMAALMTATYVQARDAFRANNQPAIIGKYAFGFEWAAWACLFLATAMFCAGGRGGKNDSTSYNSNRRSFFGGKRNVSTKSRTSHFDSSKEYSV